MGPLPILPLHYHVASTSLAVQSGWMLSQPSSSSYPPSGECSGGGNGTSPWCAPAVAAAEQHQLARNRWPPPTHDDQPFGLRGEQVHRNARSLAAEAGVPGRFGHSR